jgi:hypothetical protein
VDAIWLVRVDAAGRPVAGTQQRIACDTVCLALGLVPSVDLAYLAGCRMSHVAERGGWIPDRDGEMRTSVDGVYVVGDGGGVLEHMVTTPRIAMDQARMAAIAVAEAGGALSPERARALKRELSAAHDSAGATGRGADPGVHAWLESLVAAGGMDVVVCQCEGVTRQELVDVSPPRYLGTPSASRWETKLPEVVEAGGAHPDLLKRLTRAGMGHCQGRRCREQVVMLLADATGVAVSRVPLASYRPPVRPVPMRILADQDESLAVREKWASWFSPWISVDVSNQP